MTKWGCPLPDPLRRRGRRCGSRQTVRKKPLPFRLLSELSEGKGDDVELIAFEIYWYLCVALSFRQESRR